MKRRTAANDWTEGASMTKHEATATLAHVFPGCEVSAHYDRSCGCYVALVWSPYMAPGACCDVSAYVGTGYEMSLRVLADVMRDRCEACKAFGDGEAANWYRNAAVSLTASLNGEAAGRALFEVLS